MRVWILVLVISIITAGAMAGTINVPGDAGTIQGGINLAKSGDLVLVASGIYSGDGNVLLHFDGKAITLRSQSGPGMTIIDIAYSSDEGRRGFTLHPNESPLLLIEGFTIRNGGGLEHGGAVYINACSPTFRNCRIIDNSVPQGGGIYATGVCSPAFYNCEFKGNSCSNVGSAVLVRRGAAAHFEDCLFQNNGGAHGAFLCYDASPTIVNSQFLDNSMRYHGGAVFLQDNCSPSFSECLFAGNSGSKGGAIYIQERGVSGGSCEPTFTNCTFYDNSSSRGGAVYCSGYGGPAIPVFTNCIIAYNLKSDAFDVHEGQPLLYCSDIFGNPLGDWTDEIANQAAISGNFSLDPLFCDTASGNFEIDANSPCAPDNNDCGELIGLLPVGCGAVNVFARLFVEPNPLCSYFETSVEPGNVTLYCGSSNGVCNPHDILLSSVMINGHKLPLTAEVVETNADYWGDILMVTCPIPDFLELYGQLWDTTIQPVVVTGALRGGSGVVFDGKATFIGRSRGDANGDNVVDIGDPVFILKYAFANGRPPAPLDAADANNDGLVNVGDAVYLINYIFRDGPRPGGPSISATPIPD